jgi:hypothetical protein
MLRSIVSRTYEHGPESWTHKWTRALNRVGTQGSFDSLRVLAVAILPTIADWTLLRVGNWTHFNSSTAPSLLSRPSLNGSFSHLRGSQMLAGYLRFIASSA